MLYLPAKSTHTVRLNADSKAASLDHACNAFLRTIMQHISKAVSQSFLELLALIRLSVLEQQSFVRVVTLSLSTSITYPPP